MFSANSRADHFSVYSRPLLAGGAAILALVASVVAAGNDRLDLAWRIRMEGTVNGQAAVLARTLTDLFGARLTGSPSLDAARTWVRDQLASFGVTEIGFDRWVFGHAGWTNERAVCRLVFPTAEQMRCAPVAWTPSTPGRVTATLTVVRLPSGLDDQRLAEWFDGQRPRLKGRLVMLEAPAELPAVPAAPDVWLDASRLTGFVPPTPA